MTLFSRIFSFHLNLMPLNGFHFGDVSFCLKKYEKIREVFGILIKIKQFSTTFITPSYFYLYFLYQNMISAYLEILFDIAAISIIIFHKLLLSIAKFSFIKIDLNFFPHNTATKKCLSTSELLHNNTEISFFFTMAQFSIQK